MANTYTQIFIHVVFSVQDRERIIPQSISERINKYISGIIHKRGSKVYSINAMPDHVHILLSLNPDDSLSELIKEVKRCATVFIKDNKLMPFSFQWQKGYGAFSCSKSSISAVCKYIKNQELHHKRKTFREEYVELLEKYEVEYDKAYIFQEV
ncbi:MAG: IS200/IS605 family transposase [Chloroflexota bacterium]